MREAPTSTTGLALTPEQRAECTPTCPEEGPKLTEEQRKLFALWRSQYDPAEVAYIIRNNRAATDDAIVETMNYREGCRATYAAMQAARQAPADQRAAIVDKLLGPTIAMIRQRNWPPDSAGPRIFERFATLLKDGDVDAVAARVKVGPGYGQCQDSLTRRW